MALLIEDVYLAGEPLGTIIWIVYILATAALILSQKKPKLASLDDALQSTATQGAYAPLIIGRARVGPIFIFVEDATAAQAQSLQSRALPGFSSFLLGNNGFAKGSGGLPPQPSYLEKAIHVLCVGPASSLTAIYQNGEKIWQGPITPASNPSGSAINIPNQGTFEVYWGFPDDPPLPELSTSERHGLNVVYSHAMKIFWRPWKDLGQSRQWPRLEYEVTCPCYSQISGTSSEVPLTARGDSPIWKEFDQEPGGFIGVGPGIDAEGTQKVWLHIKEYNAEKRKVGLVYAAHVSHNQFGIPAMRALFPAGSVIVLRIDAGSITASPPANTSNVGGTWSNYFPDSEFDPVAMYYWVLKCEEETVWMDAPPPFTTLTRKDLVVTLGRKLTQDEVDEFRLGLTVGNPIPTNVDPSWSNVIFAPFGNKTASPCWTRDTDGINLIHAIDQILFAKFPYGASKDRSKFDPKAIEVAAEQLQREKIRGAVAVRDGEGVESTLAAIMQDIGLMIPWDVQVGRYVMRLIRFTESAVNLPPSIILSAPTMDAIQGSRPIDVIAFTFRDRQRNYREVPLKVIDSGQVAESQNQKARKIPIEATNDRDSISRIAPRRQQEVLANLAALTFEANHAAQLACPGQRFTANETEGVGLQFLITEVQRDIDSSKVVLDTIPDTYNPPVSIPEKSSLLDPAFVPPTRRGAVEVEQMTRFQAFEMPRLLADGRVQMLFANGRPNGNVSSAIVWASLDGVSYTIIGRVPILIAGTLKIALEASSPAFDENGAYGVEPDFMDDFVQAEDLSLDEASWLAGRQILVVEDEIIFLRETAATTPELGDIVGLIRGRAGTQQAFHDEGTPFFIVLAPHVFPLESASMVPGRTIHYKVQAADLRRVSDIAQIEAQTLELQGLAYTPLPVSGLRTANMNTSYDTSLDPLVIRWNYHSDEFKRTGLGAQSFGQLSGLSRPRGHFIVEIVGFEKFTTNEPFFELSADIRSEHGLDLEPSWELRVTQVEGSFTSTPISITLTPA